MSSAPTTTPLVLDPTFLVVNAIKDDGSNTRSDITALDRNLSGLANSNTTSIMQAHERQALHQQSIDDNHFRDNLNNQNRLADTLQSDIRRNLDSLNQVTERQNLHQLMTSDNQYRDNLNNQNRIADMLQSDNRRNLDSIGQAIERNGTSNYTATQATAAATQIAVERTAAAVASAVDRNGNSNEVALERNAGQIRDLVNHQASEERANSNQNHTDILKGFRDTMIASKDSDIRLGDALRATENMINGTNYNVLKTQKDLETIAARNAADAARDSANAVRDALTNRAEIMRQAEQIANSNTRDILGMRADVMRQAADNTAAIQIEALKSKENVLGKIDHSKEYLSGKMDNQYSDLKQRIADAALLQRDIDGARLRDNANDYRIENAILRERHHHHGYDGRDGHRHNDGHIHNNLYSGHNGYPLHHHHERRFFGGEGGFGGQGFGGQGFGPNGIQSQSNSN
jgi:rubrerythrin